MPMENLNHLIPAMDSDLFDDPSLYWAIGSLMYAAIGTRPDLTFAVQKFAQFSHKPLNEHWKAVKHVLCYAQGCQQVDLWITRTCFPWLQVWYNFFPMTPSQKGNQAWTQFAWVIFTNHSGWLRLIDSLGYAKGTLNLSITYSGNKNTTIVPKGFSDADWASDCIDCKSISSYVFTLGGSTIAWSSKKQQTITLSSTEAKYMAPTHAGQHAAWLYRFFTAAGFPQNGLSHIFLDNQFTLDLVYNLEFHKWSKHIDMCHHWIHENLAADLITLEWIPTSEMAADTLTKLLPWLLSKDLPILWVWLSYSVLNIVGEC